MTGYKTGEIANLKVRFLEKKTRKNWLCCTAEQSRTHEYSHSLSHRTIILCDCLSNCRTQSPSQCHRVSITSCAVCLTDTLACRCWQSPIYSHSDADGDKCQLFSFAVFVCCRKSLLTWCNEFLKPRPTTLSTTMHIRAQYVRVFGCKFSAMSPQ